MQGVVKWFNQTKGFGFIIPEGGGRDVFVHSSVIQAGGLKRLDEGDRVEYEVQDSDKGPKATLVKTVE